ncbi:unnamed protein product [Miscanthus lutarioriparius]|uniref:Uncharacterized protein n=1 Tax=Miscanthus lutarioriparius TaxID=422564 RepID=A0A811NJD2_9POAL|nr:unnamed protein product [Miscanthus lutarioriparius]
MGVLNAVSAKTDYFNRWLLRMSTTACRSTRGPVRRRPTRSASLGSLHVALSLPTFLYWKHHVRMVLQEIAKQAVLWVMAGAKALGEVWKYQKYLEDVSKLSKCEVLVVRFAGHAIKLALLHLLKKCSGVKKIVVDYLVSRNNDKCGCIAWECQCDSWILGHGEEDIAMDLLEHVEIGALTPAYYKVEFVTMLCQYSATFQNRVTVTLIENKHSKYIQEELHIICVPNDKLVINVQSTQAGPDFRDSPL